MSDRAQQGSHQEEAQYYYDLATGQDADVPEAVSSHIRQCSSCRRRIVRLKEAVFGAQSRASRQRSPMNRDVIDALDSHFQYLDEQVACSRVRPFLPDLLQPSLKLRIPTPITVHVDQCPQCARDLEALRKLGLGSEQLERLRRLYGAKPPRSFLLCRRARSITAAFARGSVKGIGSETLSHLSTCPRCRAEVYARRQALLEERSGTLDDRCVGVSPAGLLDLVVPGGGAIRDAMPPDASHAGTCRKCLEAIQALHRTIYGILERPESGVSTIYSTIEDTDAFAASPGDPYADYPIRVRIIRREPQRAVAPSQAPVRRRIAAERETVNPYVRRLLKTAVAAAVILLATLFFYTQGGSGTTLAEVFRVFGQARNVRVVGFYPNKSEATYELWVARELNLAGMKSAGGCVVYDLAGKRMADVGSGDVTAVDDLEFARVKQMADRCLGFTLADVPADAAWDRVDADGGREVYELVWTSQTYAGRDVAVKYEVTIDKSTMLPESLRMFILDSVKTGWRCTSQTILEYPPDAEMKSVMAGESLPSMGPRL